MQFPKLKLKRGGIDIRPYHKFLPSRIKKFPTQKAMQSQIIIMAGAKVAAAVMVAAAILGILRRLPGPLKANGNWTKQKACYIPT
jgi:hypothetical protein